MASSVARALGGLPGIEGQDGHAPPAREDADGMAPGQRVRVLRAEDMVRLGQQ